LVKSFEETMNFKSLITNICLGTLLVVVPTTSNADTILGVYVSASSWSPDISGDISDVGSDINIEDQLGITDDTSSLFSFALEHPIPVLPNIKIQKTSLDTTSSSILNTDITFGTETFVSGTSINSLIDLSHTDYILYYELLDNWVSLDLGITVMNFGGDINIQSSAQSSAVDLDDYIPAGYAKVSFELPLTGMYAGAEGSMLSIGDNSISDYEVFLGWESDFGLGVEAGYHSFGVDWDDIYDSSGDINFDGY
jgi:outer membrane protein